MDDTFELPEDLKAAHLKVKEGNQDGLHLARKWGPRTILQKGSNSHGCLRMVNYYPLVMAP